MKSRITLVALAAGALVATLAGPALAEHGVTAPNRLHSFVYNPANTSERDPAGAAAWVGKHDGVTDSPLDPSNGKALRVIVPAGDAAETYTNRAGSNLNMPVGNVSNLSYDVRTSDIQGGSPRIVVVMQDGSVAQLVSSAPCATPLNGTWSRSDFTGDSTLGACTITYSDGTSYTSDGTNSAWDLFAAANSTEVVHYDFLLFDITSSSSTYFVDRIALGDGYMHDVGNASAVDCDTETAC